MCACVRTLNKQILSSSISNSAGGNLKDEDEEEEELNVNVSVMTSDVC